MAIDPVAKETTPVKQTGIGNVVQLSVFRSPQQAGRDDRSAGDQVQLSGGSDSRYQEIRHKNDQGNAQAGAIRDTDRSLAQLGQKIDGLKAPLEAIVKNFPPFSPGDEARVKFLMKYASLRKEIDELTFPPPPDVVAARLTEKLPAPLAMDATDSQIADHVAKLDAAGSSLQGVRAGLKADTAGFVQGGGFAQLFSGAAGTASAGDQALSETDAAQKSAEVGEQFAKVVRQGVAAASSQFLKGSS